MTRPFEFKLAVIRKRKTPKKPQKSVTFNLDQDESASTVVTKKHTRKSQGTIEYIISDSERSKAKKIGATAVHDKDSFPLEDEVGISGDMSAYLSVPSWEHLVDTVDTVERAPDGTLNIYFTVKGGERVMTSSECCSQRFPRKAST
ncbi:hypothetical protein C0993_000558 [Termitomyces sp. T159_Od127]|nr:hypothetical protein C0993_000558 [Termitomyces sp. T159_Od127]